MLRKRHIIKSINDLLKNKANTLPVYIENTPQLALLRKIYPELTYLLYTYYIVSSIEKRLLKNSWIENTAARFVSGRCESICET